MANITFGRKSLRHPTPTNVSTVIAVFTVIASIVATWVGTANFIPAKPSTVIQSVLTLFIGIANGIKPFFGVETTQKSVPISEVDTMDSK